MNHFTNILSTLFGYLAKCNFPTAIQSKINAFYGSLFKIDLSDFEPMSSYKNLNALFTRKLTSPRKIDDSPKSIISPCDGLITQFGKIADNQALQIKGQSYRINDFLTIHSFFDKDKGASFDGGDYINFYLSPKDYHCYHAPCDMVVHKAIHIPGALFPVNLKYLNKKERLFIRNERVILECSQPSTDKILYLVFVGALNVGGMKFGFDEQITTNKDDAIKQYHYDNVKISKGAYLGNFEMGSTIIWISQKGLISPQLQTMQTVRFGDVIGAMA